MYRYLSLYIYISDDFNGVFLYFSFKDRRKEKDIRTYAFICKIFKSVLVNPSNGAFVVEAAAATFDVVIYLLEEI